MIKPRIVISLDQKTIANLEKISEQNAFSKSIIIQLLINNHIKEGLTL